jgi:stage III sporulation protein AE
MGITGVVSGSADAAALKAAKLTFSGVVPVVGGILSDASEAVLVGAGLVKNAVGVYGLLAVLAIWIGPFIKIGAQYLLLKMTHALCGAFSADTAGKLIQDFSTAMGLLLAATAAICVLFLVSIICFMKVTT